jgi:transcriptional regulator with XRE-family HTH domain
MYKFDTDKVRGCMAEKGLIQPDVCRALQISIPAFRNKMNGKSSFNVEEVCALAYLFKIEPGIFFAFKVSDNDTK